MIFKKVVLAAVVMSFSAVTVLGQSVEKYSASFSFPLSVVASFSGKNSQSIPSFFRTAGRPAQRGIITLEWSANAPSSKGAISIYSFSGALVKRIAISKNSGSVQCDISKAATGVYIASLTFGAYRQNLKLALYK